MEFTTYAVPVGADLDKPEQHVDVLHTSDSSKAFKKAFATHFNGECAYVIRNKDDEMIFKAGF